MNDWKSYAPVCSEVVRSDLRRGYVGRRPVWDLSSHFAVPADRVQRPIISDVPFSDPI